MTLVRRAFLLGPIAAVRAGALDKLTGRWRTRFTVIRQKRRMVTPARMQFAGDGAFLIEEYAPGSALAYLYRGTASVNEAGELSIAVTAVSDSGGGEPEADRIRYRAGETYNLGMLEFQSSTSARVGALALQRELD